MNHTSIDVIFWYIDIINQYSLPFMKAPTLTIITRFIEISHHVLDVIHNSLVFQKTSSKLLSTKSLHLHNTWFAFDNASSSGSKFYYLPINIVKSCKRFFTLVTYQPIKLPHKHSNLSESYTKHWTDLKSISIWTKRIKFIHPLFFT